MRKRDRSEGTVNGTLTYRYWNNTTKQWSTSYYSALERQHTDVMSDVVTPNWGRVRHEQVVVNPMDHFYQLKTSEVGSSNFSHTSGDKIERTGPHGSWYESMYPPLWANAGITPWATLNDWDTNQLISTAKFKALAAIDRSPYAFMEDLFEIRSTIMTLRAPLAQAASAADAFKMDASRRKGHYLKKGLNPIRAAAKAAGSAWLQARYVFRPIIMSSLGIIDNVANAPRTRPKRMKAVGNSDASASGSKSIPCGSNITYSYSTDFIASARAGVYYHVSNPLDDWKFQLGLRPKDIPATIWAVMPYSWVIDRFVDISGAIRGVTNLLDPSVQIENAYTTYSYSGTRTLNSSEYGVSGWSGSGSGVTTSKEEYHRRGLWSPTLLDAFPQLDVASALSDISNVADLASLVVQRLR